MAACTQGEESPTASPATPPTTEPTVSRTPLPPPTSTAQPLQGIERLIQALDDSDADARVQAMGGLEEMGTDGRKAVPTLVGLLANDGDEEVRSAAARALGLIGHQEPEVYPALWGAAVQDNDAVVRAMARLAFLEAVDTRRQEEQPAAGPAYAEVDVLGQEPGGP